MLSSPPRSTSTASSAEAEAAAKRVDALAAVSGLGADALVASTPATVRWLLCGRGRPVDAASPEAAYTVIVAEGLAAVLTPNIEAPRVAAEERFGELGYEVVAYPWHAGPEGTVRRLVGSRRRLADADAERALGPLRRTLREAERERLRRVGADAAAALAAVATRLAPGMRESEVGAALASATRARGLVAPVVLVAGAARQRVHRHPLPTDAELGPHTLLAVTAERDGLYASLTRIVSFGTPPPRLAELVAAVAEVDAVALRASRPGRTLGDAFADVAEAYAARGFPDEWRHHHQGGLTGYRGREVFAVPGEPTPIPPSAAVAWNPSITGGAKSEDTALVSADGREVVTRTPELPELVVDGVPRPAILEL